MIPGLVSKLSEEVIVAAATIAPKSDLVRVSGTTAIATIVAPFGGGFSGHMIFVATAAGVNTVTSGNIQTAVTLNANVATVFVYSKLANKWFPGALA